MNTNKSLCAACGGTGEILEPVYRGDEEFPMDGELTTCHACRGVGLFLSSRRPEPTTTKPGIEIAVEAFERALAKQRS